MTPSVHVEASVEIERSPAEVWDAIADYSFDRQWRNGLLEMTPDPPGPAAMGTKVHEVVRSSGREYVADTVVTRFDPGISYRFEGAGTIGGVGGGRTVRPAAQGTARGSPTRWIWSRGAPCDYSGLFSAPSCARG